MAKVDLKNFVNPTTDTVLESVRLNESETPLIFFTTEGQSVQLHFCSEPDIKGYNHCNGEDCILCKIGKKVEEKIMIPVYHAAEERVGTLLISTTMTPHALMPQLAPIWESENLQIVFISRSGGKYTVNHRDLAPGVDAGESIIKRFSEQLDAGEIDITSVYSRISNDLLAEVPEISRHMAMKGITIDAG